MSDSNSVKPAEALPCAHCGGEPAIISLNNPETGKVGKRIYCAACQMRQWWHATEADAVAAWNRRATAPSAEAGALEVLRVLCEHIEDEDFTSAQQVARNAGRAVLAAAGGKHGNR